MPHQAKKKKKKKDRSTTYDVEIVCLTMEIINMFNRA